MKEALQKIWAAIAAYPACMNDYVSFGRWLVYKKLVVIVWVLLVVASGVITWWVVKPEQPFALPVYYRFEDDLKVFSGEAVVVDDEKSVIYRGQIAAGLRSGQGKEFAPPREQLIYEGGFFDDAYGGQGRLYQGSELIYEGGFLAGAYSGYGTCYGNGQVAYQGQFLDGLYHGKGKLFDGGKKLYEGDFAQGLYEGVGILYDANEAAIYTGGFARGLYSGQGVQTTADGSPIYEGEFQNGVYHGAGRLYSDGGVRLRFQGSFVNGAPSRSGGIFNERGQLLYDGNIYGGKVDYLALLGLSAESLLQAVKELPVIYYGGGYVGYLYRELGFAAIIQYDYSAYLNFYDSTDAQDDTALFAKPSDNLIVNTLLIDGAQFYEQIPTEQVVEVEKQALSGFEGFMESRLANIRYPGYRLDFAAQTMTRGDHLYEVTELPDTVEYDGVGVLRNSVSYYYRTDGFSKGSIPLVIICSKAKYGG